MDTNNLFRLVDDLEGAKDEHILVLDQDGSPVAFECGCEKPEKFVQEFAKLTERHDKERKEMLEVRSKMLAPPKSEVEVTESRFTDVKISEFKELPNQKLAPKAKFHGILIGPPGVGKGTQCDDLKKHVDYEHISTGNLVRAEIQNGSEIGKQIKEITEKGGLVPDSIICEMLLQKLNSLPLDRAWMLDGFPRSIEQA